MNIYLIGMMGSGKTTTGRCLSLKLHREFVDLDRKIEKEQGMSVAEIFEKNGEPHFRRLERSAVKEISERDNLIVSTGGGAPCDEENWSALAKSGVTIWLKGSPRVLFSRLERTMARTRPLLASALSIERIEELLQKRAPYYNRADFAVETDLLATEEVAEKIEQFVSKKLQ